MKGQQINNIKQAKEFMLAGNATFTVVSKASNTRYTFKVQKGKKDDAPHFVKFLNGSDNENSFMFIGTLFGEDTYRHSKKTPIKDDATVVKTFKWVLNVLNGRFDKSNFNLIEFWHEGKCGRCGRKLTVPSSIESGMGPHCAGKVSAKSKEQIRDNKLEVLLHNQS